MNTLNASNSWHSAFLVCLCMVLSPKHQTCSINISEVVLAYLLLACKLLMLLQCAVIQRVFKARNEKYQSTKLDMTVQVHTQLPCRKGISFSNARCRCFQLHKKKSAESFAGRRSSRSFAGTPRLVVSISQAASEARDKVYSEKLSTCCLCL